MPDEWFAKGAITRYGRPFQNVTLPYTCAVSRSYNPPRASPPERFGLFPVRSPLLGESLNYFLFLRVLRCFSSPRSPRLMAVGALQAPGLSHSEITGSMAMCAYPVLIAACHVLHRLSEPRHPPSALSYFLPLGSHKNQRHRHCGAMGCGSLLILSAVFYCPYQKGKGRIEVLSYFLTVLLVSICQRSCGTTCAVAAMSPRSGEYRSRTDDLLHAMQAL